MRIVDVSETFPPEVNGSALTAQRTGHGLRTAGHAVLVQFENRPQALVQQARAAEPAVA